MARDQWRKPLGRHQSSGMTNTSRSRWAMRRAPRSWLSAIRPGTRKRDHASECAGVCEGASGLNLIEGLELQCKYDAVLRAHVHPASQTVLGRHLALGVPISRRRKVAPIFQNFAKATMPFGELQCSEFYNMIVEGQPTIVLEEYNLVCW